MKANISAINRSLSPAPSWMGRLLRAAAAYNLVWGSTVVLAPGLFFSLANLEPPLYPVLWQGIGMIVGVFDIGYLIAAADPFRHWPIVFVGLLGKLFGPIGYVWAVLTNGVPAPFGWTLITNDIIWWVPFAIILFRAASYHQADGATEVSSGHSPLHLLRSTTTSMGNNVVSLSMSHPVLLVFLRHFGCTFCKETMTLLGRHRAEIEANGTRIVLVHMSPPDRAENVLPAYGLSGVDHISDPERKLYRAFGLKRGEPAQLFGPKVWWRAVIATLRGNVAGKLEGDGFQMPGAALIYRGEVVSTHRHRTAADQPDYVTFSRCDTCPSEAA